MKKIVFIYVCLLLTLVPVGAESNDSEQCFADTAPSSWVELDLDGQVDEHNECAVSDDDTLLGQLEGCIAKLETVYQQRYAAGKKGRLKSCVAAASKIGIASVSSVALIEGIYYAIDLFFEKKLAQYGPRFILPFHKAPMEKVFAAIKEAVMNDAYLHIHFFSGAIFLLLIEQAIHGMHHKRTINNLEHEIPSDLPSALNQVKHRLLVENAQEAENKQVSDVLACIELIEVLLHDMHHDSTTHQNVGKQTDMNDVFGIKNILFGMAKVFSIGVINYVITSGLYNLEGNLIREARTSDWYWDEWDQSDSGNFVENVDDLFERYFLQVFPACNGAVLMFLLQKSIAYFKNRTVCKQATSFAQRLEVLQQKIAALKSKTVLIDADDNNSEGSVELLQDTALDKEETEMLLDQSLVSAEL